MAAGAEGGKGTLNSRAFHPFKLVDGVTGGVGAANTQATGEVYSLHNISDFKRLYTQSSGGAGTGHVALPAIWLRNSAGVVLHGKESPGLFAEPGP